MKTIRRQSQSSLRVSQNAKTKREYSAASSPRTDRAGFKSSLSHPRGGGGAHCNFSRLINHNGSFNRPAAASAVRRVGLSLTVERGALSTGRALPLRKQLIPGTLGLSKSRRADSQASPLKLSGCTCPGKDRRQQIQRYRSPAHACRRAS